MSDLCNTVKNSMLTYRMGRNIIRPSQERSKPQHVYSPLRQHDDGYDVHDGHVHDDARPKTLACFIKPVLHILSNYGPESNRAFRPLFLSGAGK